MSGNGSEAGARSVTRRTKSFLSILAAAFVAFGTASRLVAAQEPAAPQAVSAEQLQAAINTLGNLDYATRMNAARTVRRTPSVQAVMALMRAVDEHADGYVRYRALVLLTGFNDVRTRDSMQASLSSPNDRLRAVAYSYFEHHPESTLLASFLTALESEQGEFVRPSLVRAIAAQGQDARARQALLREVDRGQTYFRSAVVEALGDYKAAYAVDALVAIAKGDGPLVTDAAVALGKIGDRRALETLAGLQRAAPREAQPSVAAGICLLGVNCEAHENYLVETLKFGDRNLGFQELLRAAASGLGALGVAGRTEAVSALFDVGIPSRDPTRAPVALALGTVALRSPQVFLDVIGPREDRDAALSLVAEGFDMLEEDLDKERFFALVRRSYWEAPADSPARRLMQALIGKLDF